jgi:hypothetical protein
MAKVNILTLSFPGTRLVHVLAVAIHISPNNGSIEMILSGKLIYYDLPIHFACSIIKIRPLVAKLWCRFNCRFC